MKNTLSIRDTQRQSCARKVTYLKRISDGLWEWSPLRLDDVPDKLNCEPNLMNKNTLKQYIRMFQRLSTFNKHPEIDTEEVVLDWERDIPGTKFHIDYSSPISNLYGVTIYVPNKYNKDFVYGDEKVLARFQMEEWSDNYLGTPESYGGISSAEITRKDLEKYIKELIEEYDDATGEKYK